MPKRKGRGSLFDNERAPPGIQVVEQGFDREVKHARQQVNVDLGAQDRGGAQRRCRLAHTVDARDDGLAHAGRQVRRGGIGQLVQEERMPTASRVQLGGPLFADELGDGFEVEWSKRQQRCWPEAGSLGAPGGDHQQPRAAPHCETQPLDRARPGEVHVLDDQDRRPVSGGSLDRRQQGGEQQGPPAAASATVVGPGAAAALNRPSSGPRTGSASARTA